MRTKRQTLVTEAPDGRKTTLLLPVPLAWAAARGIAIGTHHDVELYGEYGMAQFNADGGGVVVWNSKSTTPGEFTKFAANCTVCI